MMTDHFDALETRDPAEREREQFVRLRRRSRTPNRMHRGLREYSRPSILRRSPIAGRSRRSL